jgi:hypothetical protein
MGAMIPVGKVQNGLAYLDLQPPVVLAGTAATRALAGISHVMFRRISNAKRRKNRLFARLAIPASPGFTPLNPKQPR